MATENITFINNYKLNMLNESTSIIRVDISNNKTDLINVTKTPSTEMSATRLSSVSIPLSNVDTNIEMNKSDNITDPINVTKAKPIEEIVVSTPVTKQNTKTTSTETPVTELDKY